MFDGRVAVDRRRSRARRHRGCVGDGRLGFLHGRCNRDGWPRITSGRTASSPPDDDGPIVADIDVDVAIVGSGYTGLSCAIHLAEGHGIKATVLEANGVAWGCSTRNGGQAQISAGRLKRSEWIERWGVDVARKLHVEISEAFDLFRVLVHWPPDRYLELAPKYWARTRARLDPDQLGRPLGKLTIPPPEQSPPPC